MSAKRVLIVDGDPDTRAVCRMILEHRGYEVREAADGEAALAEVRASSYPVVITELTLAKLDGQALLERLNADPGTASSRIIILTARALAEERVRAERAGCAAFLTKPIEPLTLVERVERLWGENPGVQPADA